MKTHKQAAIDFLHLVTEGKVREAFDAHTSQDFIHHNPHFRGDRESLIVAMEQNHKMFSNKQYEVKNTVEEEDRVAVHGKVQLSEGGKNIVVVHIMRFQEDKIVELWDIGEEISKDSPNENGMF